MPVNSPSQPRVEAAVAKTKKPRVRHHVILAEDDAEMRALLALALTNEGYDVIECRNGEELSLCVRESSFRNSENVDIVISDIRMPEMSGLGVLKIHGPNPRCPPVILMTAFGDKALRDEAFRMGAAAFFDKPFNLEDLISKVREIAPP